MTYSDPIAQDHSAMRRALAILDGMVEKMEAGQRIEIADITMILNFLRRFGDEYHQHTEARTLVARIDEALRTKRGGDFVRNSRQLTQLLRGRFSKEDTDGMVVAEASVNFSRLERKYALEQPPDKPLPMSRNPARVQRAASY